MNKLYGYDRQKGYALKAVKENKISHFYIVSGEEACGKKTFVDFFSKLIFCENKNACGACSACKKHESLNLVDLHRIEGSNKNSIGAKDIRAMLDEIYLKPIDFTYKIYIIDEGEKLTLEASNALLKIFEEPPEYAVFFLITSNTEKIINTISSRATHIHLSPVSDELLESYIKENLAVFDKKKLDFLISYSLGNIGMAKKVIESDSFFSNRDSLIAILEGAGRKDATLLESIKRLLEENKDNSDEIYSILISLVRDIIVSKHLIKTYKIMNLDKAEIIKVLARKIDEPLKLFNGIIESIKLNERSVSTVMSMKMAFMSSLSEE